MDFWSVSVSVILSVFKCYGVLRSIAGCLRSVAECCGALPSVF